RGGANTKSTGQQIDPRSAAAALRAAAERYRNPGDENLMPVTKEQIVANLVKAYNMEVETVINYLANSLDLEGVRAEFIKQALATDIQEELTHAQRLGNRIKQLGGSVLGMLNLKMDQKTLQPPAD